MSDLLSKFLIRMILIVAVIFGAVSMTAAETASVDEMELVCANWLSYMVARNGDWAGSTQPYINRTDDIVENGIVIARCFEIEPAGYVLIPVLKELPPIKAYSDVDRFDFYASDGFGAMLREVIDNRLDNYVGLYGSLDHVQAGKSGDTRTGEEQLQMWDYYLQDSKEFEQSLNNKALMSADDYGPLLTSVWHQNTPYNNYCPYGDGGRTVVGCVATAAAQIMAYHRWPLQGTGYHAFMWMGDNSCGGGTTPVLLEAEYSDPYDWDNIVDYCVSGCTPEQQDALAELNYEVGVAFGMDYGKCGSGAYTADARTVFPTYFRYYDNIQKHDRIDYSITTYSNIIRDEIMAEYPIQYRISAHSIVCDGWREVGTETHVHMNYGWGGSSNSWYVMDNLHCNWDGCSPLVEYAITNIRPDKGIYFEADTTYGDVPFEVSFNGFSSLEVDTWSWNFGDGNTSDLQNPVHTYEKSGMFDVTLEVTAGSEVRTYNAANLIVAFADTMQSIDVMADPGGQIRLDIHATNSIPLRKMKIPVEYAGPLNLTLDSISRVGCRTESIDTCKQVHIDAWGQRFAVSIENMSGSYYNIPVGSGPVLSAYFSVPPGADLSQTVTIELDGYMSHFPMFYSSLTDYTPVLSGSMVTLNYVCGDADADGETNLVDILYLIACVYEDGPDPIPMNSGDVNADGDINLLDILQTIDKIYNHGPDLECN